MSELLRRLKMSADGITIHHDNYRKDCRDAASRIEALEAENRRLREALADAVEKYGKPGGPWNVPSEPGSWITKARAALEGEKP